MRICLHNHQHEPLAWQVGHTCELVGGHFSPLMASYQSSASPAVPSGIVLAVLTAACNACSTSGGREAPP
eukprot:1196218-Prorocentrum_minimum.AAC.2